MRQETRMKFLSITFVLLSVFFLVSISNPAYEYAWAQSTGNEHLLRFNEKYTTGDSVSANKEKTLPKNTDRYELIAGGDAIGIKIQTDGLVVVDTYHVATEHGDVNPAKAAGVQKGDVIIAVNGAKISTVAEYKEKLLRAVDAKYMDLTINRHGDVHQMPIKPVISQDGVVTTGLYLRDKLAGIGTLTYIDPKTHKYGALGHEIIDQDTNQLVKIHKGEIINSNVTSVRKAKSGKPGEKIADILFDEHLGTLEKNNHFGIYGQFESSLKSNWQQMPIAFVKEVKKGPAQILTVLEGDRVEAFNIEIIEVSHQLQKAVKGLKYVVTDQRLLERTGGIVQGMSGSPIVQEGKIIGAVTHVLVHDSTLGYGIFIEWMLQESGIDYLGQPHQNAA
ncbi:MAG: SpoIVB peptidase [Turicibacter sp.]|nr:SpoIVB peptidase [Turicibacter sp.]